MTEWLNFEPDERLAERFGDAKERARKRLNRTELTNNEFANLLLDVYEHHLEARQPVYTDGGECDE